MPIECGPALDISPPVTHMILSNEWWSKVPVSVRFEALDANPYTTFYSVAGSTEQTYTAPFFVTAEGTTTILYRSIDESRNAEATQTGFVRIDTTAPVVAGSGASLYATSGTREYVVMASDAGSGMLTFSARLDGGTVKHSETGGPARIAFANPALGTHTVAYTATDMLSNEVSGTLAFTVKATQSLSASDAGRTITLKRSGGKATRALGLTVRAASGTLLSAKTVVLERSTNGRTWTRYGSVRTTNAFGRVSVKLTFKKSGTTYWRWRSLESDVYREATAKRTKIVVR